MSAYLYLRPRPKRRPGSRKALIETAVLTELALLHAAGYLTTTVRFLFYRLVAERVIPKAYNGTRRPDQDVSVVLTELREAGVVPLDAIVDRSRGVVDFTGWTSVRECVEQAAKHAKLDRWRAAAPLLIVESDSLAGLLEPLAVEFRVVLVPLRGQGSLGLLAEVAPHVQDGTRVLYIGDWDFSGGHIEQSARERLEKITGGVLDWRRVALTEEQVFDHGLPVIEKYDARTRRRHPAVETEALDQRVLVPAVRGALDALGPVDVTAEEQAQRVAVLDRMGST